MKNQESQAAKNIWHDSTFIEWGVLLLGFSLLILYNITGKAIYLTYSSYLCIFIIALLVYLFALIGIKFGFRVHLDLDGEFNFSILIMYCIYVGTNIGLLVL